MGEQAIPADTHDIDLIGHVQRIQQLRQQARQRRHPAHRTDIVRTAQPGQIKAHHRLIKRRNETIENIEIRAQVVADD